MSFLLVSEIFLRLYPKRGYDYESFKLNYEKEPFLRNFDEVPGFRGRYRPSALLGYEHVPNSRPYINSYGMIGREYKLKKDKGIFRILLLGDSIAAQGYGARFLEDDLNNDPALSSRYKFEIWNAGVGSYDIGRYYLYLQHKGLHYKPDMVIIFLCMNDYGSSNNVYYKTEDGFEGYYFPLKELYKRHWKVSPLLMKYLYTYRFVVLKLNAHFENAIMAKGIRPLEEDGRRYLAEIKQLCSKEKMGLLLVIFPYLKPYAQYKPNEKIEYQTICHVVREMNFNYVNLYDLYDELLQKGFPLRMRDDDDIHPSEKANIFIAQEIYKYINNMMLYEFGK